MSQKENTPETVFGYFYRGDEEGIDRLLNKLEGDKRFERNKEFSSPVYDYRNSRVVIYERSSRVRILQKEDRSPSPYRSEKCFYDITSDFSLQSYSLRPIGEISEHFNF